MQDVRWNMCVYALCAQKQHREEMHVCVEMRAVCAEKKKSVCVCVYLCALCARRECMFARCVRGAEYEKRRRRNGSKQVRFCAALCAQ